MSKHTPAIVAISLCAVGLVAGGIGYSVQRTNEVSDQMNNINRQLAVLTELQQQKASQAGGPEDLSAAVQEALDKRAQEEFARKRDGLLQKVPNAIDDQPMAGKHLYGNPKARYTLVEFSDYRCPYCQRFHDTAQSLVDEAGGNMNWEFVHFPLGMHEPQASQFAAGAECVSEALGNKAFWAYSHSVFEDASADAAKVAETLGMKPEDFSRCVSDPATMAKVQEDKDKGARAGVTATPSSYIVDNKTREVVTVSGAQPRERVIEKLRTLMEQSEQVEKSASSGTTPMSPAS